MNTEMFVFYLYSENFKEAGWRQRQENLYKSKGQPHLHTEF